MMEHIRQTIEEIKLKVKLNVDIINKNQDAIKQMIKGKDSDEYAGQYDIFTNINNELLIQNNDLINVQLTLANFIEKYKETSILQPEIPMDDIYSVTDEQELFALTIKGVVGFDEKHPFYGNVDFIDRMIVYFENNEDYERCQELIVLKDKLKN